MQHVCLLTLALNSYNPSLVWLPLRLLLLYTLQYDIMLLHIIFSLFHLTPQIFAASLIPIVFQKLPISEYLTFGSECILGYLLKYYPWNGRNHSKYCIFCNSGSRRSTIQCSFVTTSRHQQIFLLIAILGYLYFQKLINL